MIPFSPNSICRSCAGSILRLPRTSLKLKLKERAAIRCMVTDSRIRASNIWAPVTTQTKPKGEDEDIHDLLVRAGFLRQAYAGIFHMLPLGVRVQEKIEKLIDKNMRKIGASKLALSSISSEDLWRKTDRLDKMGKELFRFKDRKDKKFILAPTHEEEITSLVRAGASSYKQFPIRLYQIGRKYRDERRPRGGLLRGREFTMKDLYTFDVSSTAALTTYNEVQEAYRAIFDELGVPYLVCHADTGAMGGSLSHEFHFASPAGEDTFVRCTSCGFSANEESITALPPKLEGKNLLEPKDVVVWHGVSKDRLTLVKVYFPRRSSETIFDSDTQGEKKTIWKANEVNVHAVRELLGSGKDELDPSVDSANAFPQWSDSFTAYPLGQDGTNPVYSKIVKAYDCRLLEGDGVSKLSTFSNHADVSFAPHEVSHPPVVGETSSTPSSALGEYTSKQIPTTIIIKHPSSNEEEDVPLNLLRITHGDRCPECEAESLNTTTTIELGHTFHLGTRYSDPLGAFAKMSDGEYVPLEMGCHGIGVTRMITAVADALRDSRGLCWPNAVAPFAVVIVYSGEESHDWARNGGEEVYDMLVAPERPVVPPEDIILDDRKQSLGWKMKDADLIGYSVMVVVGRRWKEGEKVVEVQQRRTGTRREIELGELEDEILLMLS